MNRAQNDFYERGLQEDRDRERRRRAAEHLTVVKQVRTLAHCTACGYQRPYKPGDEERPCPSCQGGKIQSWPSVRGGGLTGRGL